MKTEKTYYLLIADSEPIWRTFSKDTLLACGYRVDAVSALPKAIHFLKQDGYDLIIVNAALLHTAKAELIDYLKQYCRHTMMIVLSDPYVSRSRSMSEARTAFRIGAKEWAMKPMAREPLINLIDAFIFKQISRL